MPYKYVDQDKPAQVLYDEQAWYALSFKHVLCSDGIRRTARVTEIATGDFFPIRAATQCKGKGITGNLFLTSINGQQDIIFEADVQSKHADMLPAWNPRPCNIAPYFTVG